MRVIGLDPGLQCTGYGIVEVKKGKNLFISRGRDSSLVLLEAGVIRTSLKDNLTVRLYKIYSGLQQIVEQYHPDVFALEELYSHYKNPRTAIMMAHARGVICLAAAQMNVPVFGYAAKRAKKAITGSGGAKKMQMQMVIKELFGLKAVPEPNDVADAISLALTHINTVRDKL